MKKTTKKIKYFLFTLLAFFAGFFVVKFALASSDQVIINEVLLSGGSGKSSAEFIELYNPTDSDIDLSVLPLKLHIVNSKNSDSGKILTFINKMILKKGYFLIASKDYADDPGNLEKPDATYSSSGNSLVTDGASYISTSSKAKENIIDSVSFGSNTYFDKPTILNVDNGKSIEKKALGWQESNTIGGTPGKDNSAWTIITAGTEIGASSGIEIIKDKKIYTNVYANFEVKYAEATSNTKYTWNFGDNHKSYKQKIRHKFISPGTYQATITIRGDKSAKKNFEIIVENYEAPKIRIIRLSPNPKGKDTGNEWIEIQNNSKKKVNLKDWTIATGWEKLVNHKITKKFVLKAKETKKLTRDYCAFTLNNTKLKLELRDPSGETLQKLKYNRKKEKIEEDEIFALSGKKWNWDKTQVETDEENINSDEQEQTGGDIKLPPENIPEEEYNEIDIDQKIDFQIPAFEIEAGIGKSTTDISWEKKRENRFQLISYGTTINMPAISGNQPMVAGVSTEKKMPPTERHWAAQLGKNIWKRFNLFMNLAVSYL
ncbi:MAG TPA: lamin tail domain-containing protein [Patescibacteria group bacterium]|nr:lamin tail domain-containing protein [Patescibacteria group bacterium]